MPITVDSKGVADNSGWRRHDFLVKVETMLADHFGNDDRNITVTLSDQEDGKLDLHCELRVAGSLICEHKFSVPDTEQYIIDVIENMLTHLDSPTTE